MGHGRGRCAVAQILTLILNFLFVFYFTLTTLPVFSQSRHHAKVVECWHRERGEELGRSYWLYNISFPSAEKGYIILRWESGFDISLSVFLSMSIYIFFSIWPHSWKDPPYNYVQLSFCVAASLKRKFRASSFALTKGLPSKCQLWKLYLSTQLLNTNISCNIPTDAARQFRFFFSLENDPLFRLLQRLSVDLSPSVRRSFCRSSVHPFIYLCFLCCSICLIYFPFYSIFLSKFPIYFIRRVILFVSPACLSVTMAGGSFLVFLSTCLVFTFLAIFVSVEVSSSFRPDQYSVVTGSKDCSMKIWSLSNGKLSSCLLGCNALTWSRCACVVKRDSWTFPRD